jgi:hypothetical protein
MRNAAAVVLAAFGVLLVVTGAIGFVQSVFSHEEPGGRAKVQHPFLDQTCFRTGCVSDTPKVELALRDGGSDEVEDRELYDRARGQGPFFVEVRWLSASHSVTQVREDGRWRVVAHAAAGDAFGAILEVIVGGLVLLVSAGVWSGRGRTRRGSASVAPAGGSGGSVELEPGKSGG